MTKIYNPFSPSYGTYTVTDVSGASLSLITNYATFVRTGKLVDVIFSVTYPANSDKTNAALWGSLPTLPNSATFDFIGSLLDIPDFLVFGLLIQGATNPAAINIITNIASNGYVFQRNTDLAGKTLAGVLRYLTP